MLLLYSVAVLNKYVQCLAQSLASWEGVHLWEGGSCCIVVFWLQPGMGWLELCAFGPLHISPLLKVPLWVRLSYLIISLTWMWVLWGTDYIFLLCDSAGQHSSWSLVSCQKVSAQWMSEWREVGMRFKGVIWNLRKTLEPELCWMKTVEKIQGFKIHLRYGLWWGSKLTSIFEQEIRESGSQQEMGRLGFIVKI